MYIPNNNKDKENCNNSPREANNISQKTQFSCINEDTDENVLSTSNSILQQSKSQQTVIENPLLLNQQSFQSPLPIPSIQIPIQLNNSSNIPTFSSSSQYQLNSSLQQ